MMHADPMQKQTGGIMLDGFQLQRIASVQSRNASNGEWQCYGLGGFGRSVCSNCAEE
jgi:hypothetical protein